MRIHYPLRPHSVGKFGVVHWHVILLALGMLFAASGHASAQQADTARVDTLRRLTFPSVKALSPMDTTPVLERAIDGVVSGGAGFYSQGSTSTVQGIADLNFFAQTSILDLNVGFEWGFSKPATKGLNVGLRFPLTESRLSNSGLYFDAGLFFFDPGAEFSEFQTGLRFALADRSAPSHLEYRLVGELREPGLQSGGTVSAWAGIELGFFFNIQREEIRGPSRKDSLRAALRYIATSSELEGLDAVSSDEALDRWLDTFWQARNLTPKSPRNDARLEYMRRVTLANREFSSSRQMGVQTDQGRVLLIYGEPDRKEGVASTADPARRYMLWVYSDRVSGYQNAIFLFLAESGTSVESNIFASHGGYRQVYSNVLGEASEGIPSDLPPAMLNYIETFGR